VHPLNNFAYFLRYQKSERALSLFLMPVCSRQINGLMKGENVLILFHARHLDGM